MYELASTANGLHLLELLSDNLCQLLRAARFALEKVPLLLRLRAGRPRRSARRRPLRRRRETAALTPPALARMVLHGQRHAVMRHLRHLLILSLIITARNARHRSHFGPRHLHLLVLHQLHAVLRIMAHHQHTVGRTRSRRVTDTLMERQ